MRKSVELGVEWCITMALLPTIMPILTAICVAYITPYVSWGFAFCNVIVYCFNILI